jgi:murein DD-endopeptidase MepM/ murein hydrolase activator NlpD
VSPRRAPRAAHARPRVPDTPAALVPIHPLTPLAERERRHHRPGRRFVTIVGAGLAIAAALPLLGAAMAPAAPQLRPIAITGAVAGAADVPAPSLAPIVAPTSASDPIRVRNRMTAGALLAEEPVAPGLATLTGYQWPLRAGRISLPFKAIPGGEWINAGKLFHDGVDMASFCGAPVRAAHDGVVLAAGRRFDDAIGWVGDLRPYYRRLDSTHSWGNLPIVVVIDDGNGYRSIYAHFRDVTVKPGQTVRGGQVIGHEGATGHASGCHVHYGLFSPLETRTFGVRPDIVRRMRLPKFEIARVDPLAVLPGGDVALRTRTIAKAIAAAAAAGPRGDAAPPYTPPARLS